MADDNLLEEDIEEARCLDSLRKQTMKMMKEGLKGLFCEQYKPGRLNWSEPASYIEKALLLDAITKYEDTEAHSDLREKLSKELRNLRIDELFGSGDFLESEKNHVPVLKACLTLNSLSNIPDDVLSKGAINCYCRILYELNMASNIDEMAGGASAGAENVPKTAFITWRCVRAVLSFSSAFEKTSKSLLALSAITESKSPNFPGEWCHVNKTRAELQTQLTLEYLRGNSLYSTGSIIDQSNRQELINDLCNRLKAGCKNLKTTILNVNKKTDSFNANACKKAVESLETLAKFFRELIKVFEKLKLKPESMGEALKRASSILMDVAFHVRLDLELTKKFLSYVMDREFTTATLDPQRSCDAAELLFAADGYGRLCAWDDKRLLSTLEKALPLLTNNGRFPSNRPFDVTRKAYVLHVSGVEVIDATSHLISQMEYSVNPDIVKRFLRYFTETWRDEARGWRHERDHPKGKCAWWVSALSIDTLDSLRQMIDRQINWLIFKHVNVRQPDKLTLDLDALFYSDYGLAAAGVRERSMAIDFQRLLAHLLNVKLIQYESLHAVILHGPPGTGKTTPVEALAKSANVPIVEVTPSDILLAGAERVETRARFVFEALSLLSDAVILLDEFDSILRRRKDDETPENIFQFLTPGMLPKIKNLYESTKVQRVAYVLSTNLIGGLDGAAIREGRFDEKIGIYPPDALSRAGRLFCELSQIEETLNTEQQARFDEVVCQSSGCAMSRLSKPGWFTWDAHPAKGTPLYYILSGGDKPVWPPPEIELPEHPVGVKDSNCNPLEVCLREWNEWKWVSCLDKQAKENGILSISAFIKSWRNSNINSRPGTTNWREWNDMCEKLSNKRKRNRNNT